MELCSALEQWIFLWHRLHAVTMIADIEAMLFQVRVIEKDQQSLRFLWRGPNRDHPSDVYQMQAMIFGAKSSPTSEIIVWREQPLITKTLAEKKLPVQS